MEIKTLNFKSVDFDPTRYSQMRDLYRIDICSFNPMDSVTTNLLNTKFDSIEFSKNIENTFIYELSSAQFYALEDRSWIEDKHIILSNIGEPWILGVPFDDQVEYQPQVFEDPTIFDHVKNAKSFTVVCDNADVRLKQRYPNINWVHANIWHKEVINSFDESLLEQDWAKDIDMHQFIDQYTHNNKEHDFTALLGKVKPHRLDFWFKCIDSPGDLVYNNIIGSWDKHFINPKYESDPDHTKDRIIKEEWIKKSKVWISLETFPEISDPLYPITQITEKTFKPIRYGMPFLINGSKQILDILTDMGYDNYTSVFGNYIENDYKHTNLNIINIIKNIDEYDWSKIKSIAHKNIDVLQSWDNNRYYEYYRKALNYGH